MSTNATISVKINEENIRQIYLHWDGDSAGAILKKYYNTQELAEKVISLGNLSSLDESMNCPKGHSFEHQIPGYSVAYGRDRGEDNTEARKCSNESMITHNEYVYFWNGEKWITKCY